MRSWVSLLLFFFPICLQAATITLCNDSPYPLIAKIFDGQGTLVGNISLDPGVTRGWDYQQNSFSPQHNTPYTPYTVRWYCNTGDTPYDYNKKNKKDDNNDTPEYTNGFGSWTNVPPGSYVNAQGCPNGNHTCVVKKKKPDEKDKTKPTPDAQSNETFLNDGGMDWSNNGGPGSTKDNLFPQTKDSSPYDTSPSRWKND
jgi:hypothetical protein